MSRNGFFTNRVGMLHDRWILIGLLVFTVLFLGSCFGLGALQGWLKCNEFTAMNPSFNFDWTFLNACMVQTQEGNAWISADKLLELVN